MLEAVFGSLRTGVVVLDNDLRVQIWNKGAERMWGLSEEEARGKEFMTLEIGITVSQLEPLIRARLEGTHEDGEQ
jgi:two-component system CheB/CheR fusion protein